MVIAQHLGLDRVVLFGIDWGEALRQSISLILHFLIILHTRYEQHIVADH